MIKETCWDTAKQFGGKGKFTTPDIDWAAVAYIHTDSDLAWLLLHHLAKTDEALGAIWTGI